MQRVFCRRISSSSPHWRTPAQQAIDRLRTAIRQRAVRLRQPRHLRQPQRPLRHLQYREGPPQSTPLHLLIQPHYYAGLGGKLAVRDGPNRIDQRTCCSGRHRHSYDRQHNWTSDIDKRRHCEHSSQFYQRPNERFDRGQHTNTHG